MFEPLPDIRPVAPSPSRPAPHGAARPGPLTRALVLLAAAMGLGAAPAAAQTPAAVATAPRAIVTDTAWGELDTTLRPTVPIVSRFRSTRDSVAFERTRDAADRASGTRIVVLLEERQLAVLRGADTLMIAPVAIGMDTTITYGARSWTFETPRGRRSVLRKEKDPIWVPPDWHYAEVAGKRGLALARLRPNVPVRLVDGRSLVVRGGRAGVVEAGLFQALPADEEIVFDGTLYVPPLGSQNRRIPGELGRFKLDLGNGYLLHGTPHEDTIGDAATHGCVRLFDEDIEWLYENVPVGTPVFIY